MGKFDGRQIEGIVGGLIFRRGKNKTIMQVRPAEITQTAETKAAATLFGMASMFSKRIRYDFNDTIRGFYDGGMVNRLTNLNRTILSQCFDKDTQKFVFNENSFSRLAGFEFNLKSPLTASLWVEPEVTLSGNILTVRLPEIEIPAQLKLPNYANLCKITVSTQLYVLNQSLKKKLPRQVVEVSKSQATLPAQEFIFEVPDGALCISTINLDYFFLSNNIQTVLNQKTFNPTSICGAIMLPGTFVAPVQTDPHFANISWHPMDGLTLQC